VVFFAASLAAEVPAAIWNNFIFKQSGVLMKLKTLKVEYITCAKCGRRLTAPKECAEIAGDIDTPLCGHCYRTVLFPDVKDYEGEMLDHASLPC